MESRFSLEKKWCPETNASIIFPSNVISAASRDIDAACVLARCLERGPAIEEIDPRLEGDDSWCSPTIFLRATASLRCGDVSLLKIFEVDTQICAAACVHASK